MGKNLIFHEVTSGRVPVQEREALKKAISKTGILYVDTGRAVGRDLLVSLGVRSYARGRWIWGGFEDWA